MPTLSDYVNERRKRGTTGNGNAISVSAPSTAYRTDQNSLANLVQERRARGITSKSRGSNIASRSGYAAAEDWNRGATDLLREYAEFSQNWSGDSQTFDDYRRRMEAYSNQYNSIVGGLEGDNNAKDAVSYTQLYLRRAMEGVSDDRDFWSQFGSQEEYDSAMQYLDDEQNLDLDAAYAELDALKEERENFVNMSSDELVAYREENKDNLPGYVEGMYYDMGNVVNDYDQRIKTREAYLNRIRNARQLGEMEQVIGENDFAANSAYQNPAGTSKAARTYQYINDPEYREHHDSARSGRYGRSAAAAVSALAPEEYESIDQMSDQEIATFNYYYNTQGEEAAMEYLAALTPTIRQRRAAERVEELNGRTLAEIAFAVPVGLDQFSSGVSGIFSNETQTPTWRQYAAQGVREDLADDRLFRNSKTKNSLGQAAFDAVTSISNMAPSILASSLVGLINPIAGQAVGSALMGASAAGNAYQEMLNAGYDSKSARGYGMLVGASEAVLGSLLGGITKLGGALPKGVTDLLLSNIDNAVARVAITIGANAFSEFSEEYLQTVLEPYFQNLLLGTNNEVKFLTEDALYSGILGAITAGLMEGPGTIAGAASTAKTGKNFRGSIADLDQLIELGRSLSESPDVQALASRTNADSSNYHIGRLVQGVSESIDANTRASLVNRYTEYGLSSKDASAVADMVVSTINGKGLTRSQLRLLSSNEILSDAYHSSLNGMDREMQRVDTFRALNLASKFKNPDSSTKPQNAPTSTDTKTTNVQEEAQGNASQAKPRGTSTPLDAVADKYGVNKEAVSYIAEDVESSADETVLANEADAVLQYVAESDKTADEAMSAIRENNLATALNDRQLRLIINLGIDVRHDKASQMTRAYEMGHAGQDIEDVLSSQNLSSLTEEERREAFNRGAADLKAKTDKAPAKRAAEWREGSVRFDGNEKQILNFLNSNKRTKADLEILRKIARVTGKDIVLYDGGVDAEGNLSAETGKFNPNKPNEVRVEIHAGISNASEIGHFASYALLRTFTHEFTHSMEVNAPAEYAELKRVVFAQMRKNGANVEQLIESKLIAGGVDADGNYNLSYDDASHEVLADAMVDILPQTSFIETLANEHQSLFHKILASIKEFMERIRQRLSEIAGETTAEAKAAMQTIDGAMKYAQSIVDAFDKAAVATANTVQSRNMDSADAMNNTAAFEDSSVAIRNQIRPPYNENTKAFAEFADGLNAEAKETFDLFYNFYNLSRITNTTNAAGRPVKAINISAPFLSVDEWNAKISSDAKWGAAAARLAESLPVSVRENMHMNEDGSLTETPLEKEFKMQRSLAQRLVDSLPLEKIDAVYDIEGRRVELPAGKARQSVGGEAYRRAVIGEVRKLFHDGRLKQVSIGTLSKDRWGSLGFLAANGKTGASGDFTTICPQMMFNRGCFYCYRRAALESGVNNKLVAERVWYAGEILRIKQKDIDALNENGGLRIQSFGDWMPHFSAMLADVLHDAELRGLQVKIITKEPSMIQYLAALREQGLGNNLYFNLSADYAIEKAPAAANTAGSASLDHINPDRPFMRDEDKQMWWKRAMTVEEAGSFRAKYPWVNTRIVATDTEEFIRGLKDPTIDVVTGYHGNIRNYERIDSETGARKVEVEALGDAGMPRFVYENGEWITEYEGKTSTHKQLAQRIREEGLFLEYYAKVCCQTGRCATCKGKCGQMARSLAMKNATNRDSKSRAYWQEHMSSAVEDISEASPEVDSLVAEFRQRMQNLSRNNENPTGKVRYQRRENLTDRSVISRSYDLVSAIGKEDTVVGDIGSANVDDIIAFRDSLKEGERFLLETLADRLDKLNDLQAQRREQGRIYSENMYRKDGNREEAAKARKRMDLLDKQIDEASKAVREAEHGAAYKSLLAKARKLTEQTERGRVKTEVERYRDQRFRSGQLRQRRESIKRNAEDLRNLLEKGTKKRNVKDELQGLAAGTVELFDILFDETFNKHGERRKINEMMIRSGVGVELSTTEAKNFAEARKILSEIDSGHFDESMAGRLQYRMGQLKEVFERERARINKLSAGDLFDTIVKQYKSLETSNLEYVRASYNPDTYNHLLQLQRNVGTSAARDMTLSQLIDLDNAYKMVLTTVRNANKMFAENIKGTVAETGNRVLVQLYAIDRKNKSRSALRQMADKFTWNNAKPVYAFERIGSETLSELYENLRAGEDVWVTDATEANLFREGLEDKYGYKEWDFNKMFKFTSATGKEFELTLGQVMSLYAYTRREQAREHLLKGGVVLSGTETIVNGKRRMNEDANTYSISAELFAKIGESLTNEQRAFVEEMQTYLSDVMGGKGNEVSLKLYGVKLFGESNYFPIKTSSIYNPKQDPEELKKAAGMVSLANAGFSHATVQNASNPIVLNDFDAVWGGHVNEMSNYHAFVLPLEDFRKVRNYGMRGVGGLEGDGVRAAIQNAHGTAAVEYIETLLRDINGGVISDSRESAMKRLSSLGRKAQVVGSLSVVAQQLSSLPRAWAVIDPKYFVGNRVDKQNLSKQWEQLKKYAPIAAIKEMGSFNVGMGQTALEFINGKKDKGFKKVSGKIDDALSKAPEFMDKIAWVSIWNACKREARAKDSTLSGEQLYQTAATRFTEVIEKTQVYDSVFARSANMRSKSAFMGMATAFLAEPTTTANMVEAALRSKDKKRIAGTMGAVIASIIFNEICASLVYASRDDDEDETWWEKYLQSLTTGILDSFNPLTYLPIVRDVWSLLQGFDIERADMSLIADFIDSFKSALRTTGIDTSEMDEDKRKAANADKIWAWAGVLGSVVNLTGIPLKNLLREVKAVVNIFTNDTPRGGARSVGLKIWDDIRNNIPGVGLIPVDNKATRIYEAIIDGDTEYVERAKGTYSSAEAFENAIRKALKANDPRIVEAAQARMAGNNEEYARLFYEIRDEGFFEFDTIMAAINSAERDLTPDSESTAEDTPEMLFGIGEYYTALAAGDKASAKLAYDELLEAKMAEGYTEREAADSIESSFVSQVGSAYMNGDIDSNEALALLTQNTEDHGETDIKKWDFKRKYGYAWGSRHLAYRIGDISRAELVTAYMDIEGATREEANEYVDELDFENREGYDYSEIGDEYAAGNINRQQAASRFIEAGFTAEEAEEKLVVIDFEQEFSGTDGISYAAVTDYRTYCEPVGIGGKAFYDAWKTFNGIESSRDANGDVIEGQSKKEKALEYIDSLPYSTAQKDSLYLAFGYAESKLHNAPWH